MQSHEKVNIYAQGSIPEYEFDGDSADRYYLPARSLCFQTTGVEEGNSNLFVLPDSPEVQAYHSQLIDIYKQIGIPDELILKNEPVFIPDGDYLLDRSISQNVNLVAEKVLARSNRCRVLPYARTEFLDEWVNSLREKGIKVEVEMPSKVYYDDLRHFAHRGGWGRYISDPEKPSFSEVNNIPYPVSWIGQGLNEIITAYQTVADQTGNPHAFFKPLFSAGGFTLSRVSSAEEVKDHYEKLRSQGSLRILSQETPVEIQAEIQNIKGFYSLQYDGENIVTPGNVCQQLIDGMSWKGNIFNERVNNDLPNQSQEIFRRFIKGAANHSERISGLGGIDFALTKEKGGEKLVVLEHNGQRITGGHPALAMARGFKVEDLFMTQKVPGEINCDLATLWDVLRASDSQFDLTKKKGVFPVIWMKGSAMLWIAGENTTHMNQTLDNVYNNLARESYIE